MEIACDCGYAGLARSHLTPSDNADTRSVCPLLRCRNADRGCNYVAHDGTGRVLHEMSCAVRDAWCHRCFGPQEATVLDNGGDDGARAFMQQQQMHRAVCRFETPLLDWSPSLKFTTTPTQVLRLAHRLRQNTGNNQDAPVALVYSGMQTASEITSFPCKYFFLPYSQCINLFFPAINLPPVRFCHDMSYICFMFQDPEGLRMVSVRLYPRSEEFIPSLRGAMDGFLEANGIPKTHPVSVLRSVRRPECIVVMGRNGDDSGEMNIEFVDGRVEVRGGTRAHEQMYDFVHFL
ncbi:hypothetical protein HDU83_002992 [Entophlyctis luteolus]|nr:hypothetical protein HDU83_002992 [Entophlyctis luteolus]